MKKIIAVVLVIVIVGAYYVSASKKTDNTAATNPPSVTQTPASLGSCSPTQADTEGPFYKANMPFRDLLVPPNTEGEKLTIKGRLLKADCVTPIASAIIDIWQADAQGNYHDNWYRGKIRTNQNGEFQFRTIKPKEYGSGGTVRPPHIHYKVFVDDKDVFTSQLYFPNESQNATNETRILKLEPSGQGAAEINASYTIILRI